MTISLPHHSLIFSLRGATPVVSPVSGSYYRFKNRGSMNAFDLGDAVVEFETDPATFLDRIKSQIVKIGTQADAMREKNEETVSLLREAWNGFNEEFMRKISR